MTPEMTIREDSKIVDALKLVRFLGFSHSRVLIFLVILVPWWLTGLVLPG